MHSRRSGKDNDHNAGRRIDEVEEGQAGGLWRETKELFEVSVGMERREGCWKHWL